MVDELNEGVEPNFQEQEQVPVEPIVEGIPRLTVEEVMKKEVIKLDLGGGDHPAQGYINVDIKYYPQVDLLLDITKLHEAFPPKSVDGLTCRDTLQCFSHAQIRRILKNWHITMKPRSKICIQVYDVNEVVRAYSAGEIDFDKFRTVMFGRQKDNYTLFQNCFTEESLIQLLERSGFVIQETLRPPMRIKVIAMKAK